MSPWVTTDRCVVHNVRLMGPNACIALCMQGRHRVAEGHRQILHCDRTQGTAGAVPPGTENK
eukprot:3658125-Prorocentrum_lima.AAC.1